MKIMLLTGYVDNYFTNLSANFPLLFKNHNFQKDFNNSFLRYLILINKTQIIGFISYELIYDRIEIDNITIQENYQGKGLSKKLMDKLIEEATKNKCSNITLEVNNTNYKAINLYHKYNFNKVAVRKKYYQNDDALLMERKMMK